MPAVFSALSFLLTAVQSGLAALGISFSQLLSLGVSLVASLLFAPKQPKPDDVQTSVKNPTANRVRHYGRVKSSGPWVFAESKAGDFYKVIALGTGELDAIEELWIDDRLVTADGSGNVIEAPYASAYLQIFTRRGLATETNYSQLTTAFAEWTAAHRGDGVSSLLAIQRAVGSESLSDFFPNLTNTLYRVVARASKVLNPVTGVTAWSDNAAAVIRDYMTHRDGMNLPAALFTTPQAIAGWIAAFNRCVDAVTLKAGGTEPRYRLWGSYSYDERPADVIGRMIANCDGRIVPTPDGGVTLAIGAWQEPTVVIGPDAIVGFNDLARGKDVLNSPNIIAATYLSVPHDYQATDADRWINDDDIAERGEVSTSVSFNMSPSHGQARRLMKLTAYRATPAFVGSIRCNLRGLAAYNKQFIRVVYPLLAIDETCELTNFQFEFGEGMIITGAVLSVQSMPAAAYAWDAATEEGEAPVAETVEVDHTVPVPTGFTFSQEYLTVSGQSYSVGRAIFAAPPSPSLRGEVQYRKTGTTTWNAVPVQTGATSVQTPILDDGQTYEAQVRYVTSTGRYGDWTASQSFTVVSDPNAPAVVTGVSRTGGTGTVTINWTAPNSANYAAANIYRNTTNNLTTATLVRREYGPPATADTWQDTALAAGTYYYWLRASNGSGVNAAAVATGSVVVT